jgi:hypothetical protein
MLAGGRSDVDSFANAEIRARWLDRSASLCFAGIMAIRENRRPGLVIVLLLVLAAGFGVGWLCRNLNRMIDDSAGAGPRVEGPRPFGGRYIPASGEGPVAPEETQPEVAVDQMVSHRDDETILRFPDDQSYAAFLQQLEGADGVRVRGRLDRFRALRLAFHADEDWQRLMQGAELTLYPALSTTPQPSVEDVSVTAAEGFGDGVMAWLGLPAQRTHLGAGVKVAVLDSGVMPHADLPANFESIAILPFSDPPDPTNGHATAVASLILGAQGVAPAASLLSIRVTTDAGVSDSFALAQGLLAAVEAGARIVNLSLGSYEDSPLARAAVEMALEAGLILVAAAGNEAQDQPRYPAAYPGVLSVGSVDAAGRHLAFSHFGGNLALTAPGLGVRTAWTLPPHVRMTGTSVSAPLVSGALAAILSDGRARASLSAGEAVDLLLGHANDAGLPGPDSQYGHGILDIGRVLYRDVPHRHDAAITDQRLHRKHEGGPAEWLVTIQNRGTAPLVNVLLEATSPAGTQRANRTFLAPGAIHTFHLPFPFPAGQQVTVDAFLRLGDGITDLTPHNNRDIRTLAD